jgi:hemerythrin-like metal-binding protein
VPSDWSDDMSVGVDSLDVQHRQILRRIRHLATAVCGGRPDEIRAALRFLHGYLAEHAVDEERWMAEVGYPAAREHARAHADLLADFPAPGDPSDASYQRRLVEAAERVARKIEEHMREDDMRLARFFTARENLRRLAESGPGTGLALTPIPGSLAPVPGRRGPGSTEPA